MHVSVQWKSQQVSSKLQTWADSMRPRPRRYRILHQKLCQQHLVRQSRGPDTVARVRRIYREGEAQTPNPSDWSSFDVGSSLR